MSVRIIHSADLHIGSVFEGLPPEKAADRKDGQLATLEEIISVSEKNRAHAILLSGDLFDRSSASPDLIARVTGILANTGVPVFIAPGNHDHFLSDLRITLLNAGKCTYL
jgi:DNA repair exonuclease SbcCD nuclease subunit